MKVGSGRGGPFEDSSAGQTRELASGWLLLSNLQPRKFSRVNNIQAISAKYKTCLVMQKRYSVVAMHNRDIPEIRHCREAFFCKESFSSGKN